ncbi:MAG: hypothetical protein ACTSV2_18130 [Candidatus Thorarchaeota archaeon]
MDEDPRKTASNQERFDPVYATNGRIIGVDIGEWSGFLAGPVILERADTSRIELRYNASSKGPRPKIGMTVSVEYTGKHIHVIKHLKLLENYVSAAERLKDLPQSHTSLLITMPPAAKTFVGLLFIVGVFTVAYALFNDFSQVYERTSRMVYLVIAAVEFLICCGLWYIVGDS